MTVRAPLVQVAGQIEQLQAGDTLSGSGGSATPTTMQADFVIGDHQQVTATRRVIVGSGLRIKIGTDSALVVLA